MRENIRRCASRGGERWRMDRHQRALEDAHRSSLLYGCELTQNLHLF